MRKFILMGSVLMILLLFGWMERNPFTTAWVLALLGFIGYILYTVVFPKDKSNTPPPDSGDKYES